MITIENFEKLIKQRVTLVTPHRCWVLEGIIESKDAYVIRIEEQNNIWNSVIFTLDRNDTYYGGKYALKNNRDLQYKFVNRNQIAKSTEFLSELNDEIWRFN